MTVLRRHVGRNLAARLLAVLLAILPVHTAVAQETTPSALLHPALWRVRDADTTIWLFGTIHMLPPGKQWLAGPVAQAVDGADELVTEVLDPTGTDTQLALSRRALLPRGKRLRALLPDADRAAFDALLKRNAINPAVFDRYKPWYAAVALSSLPLLQRGFSVQQGVETALAARVAGRKHAALETVELQLSLLDRMPRRVQVRYLAQVVAEYDSIPIQVDRMAEAWSRGDADGLAKLINEDEGKDDPLMTDMLILRRNRTWAGWIRQRLMRPGTVFLAVGAGHLAGTGSVQDILGKAGIVSERIQ